MRTLAEVTGSRAWTTPWLRQSTEQIVASIKDYQAIANRLAALVVADANFNLLDAERALDNDTLVEDIVARIDGGDRVAVVADVLGWLDANTAVKPRPTR